MRVWRGLWRTVSSGDGVARGGRPRRRAWETSLSPLERVRRLLPPEEAAAVGRCAAAPPQVPPEEKEAAAAPQVSLEAAAAPQVPPEEEKAAAAPQVSLEAAAPPQVPPEERKKEEKAAAAPRVSPEVAAAPHVPPEEYKEEEKAAAAPQVSLEAVGARPGPFRAGELALAEVRRKHNALLKLLCRLTVGSVLASPKGFLPHCDIIGQLPGQMLRTSAGAPLLLRRPSLEEYVLLMPRGPTIAYPKDISAILTMMDVHPGDTVLETGSGSGAMSLFLSRAVGPKGRVISYEVRDDHHNLAKKNYRHWRAAWKIGHMEEWPDNVDFILKDISTAAADMKSVTVDAIVLDMLNPQSALPVVHPSLKQGGVCAVYLANITQVIDLLDRIRTCKLPFLCERIIEVTYRNWLVLPAKTKNCKSSQMVETQENIEEPPQKEYEEIHIQDQAVLKESEYKESLSDAAETNCSMPYVARPSYWQDGHSAFLTKLRKFRPPLS